MDYYRVFGLILTCTVMLGVGCSEDSSQSGGTGGTAGTAGTAGGGGVVPPGAGGIGGIGGSAGSPGLTTKSKELSLGCSNSSPIGAQSILSAELEVTADTISGDENFDAVLSGTARFPESFLDAAQALILGGLKEAVLVDLKYIVQVRSGAEIVDGSEDVPGVPLTADISMLTPGEVRLCNFPSDLECTQNSDCVGQICNDPIVLVEVPTSDDCAPGGVCDTLGKGTSEDVGTQCGNNGFCVTGGIDVPLVSTTQTYAADASGEVLFGWADQDLTNSTFDPNTGLFTIPKPLASDPTEQGLKVAAGLTVAIECVMGVDEGLDPTDPENDLVGLTPDSDLISFPIE